VFSKFASAEEVTGAAPAEGEGDEEAKAEPVKEEVRPGEAALRCKLLTTKSIARGWVCLQGCCEQGGSGQSAKRAALPTVCRTPVCSSVLAQPCCSASRAHSRQRSWLLAPWSCVPRGPGGGGAQMRRRRSHQGACVMAASSADGADW